MTTRVDKDVVGRDSVGARFLGTGRVRRVSTARMRWTNTHYPGCGGGDHDHVTGGAALLSMFRIRRPSVVRGPVGSLVLFCCANTLRFYPFESNGVFRPKLRRRSRNFLRVLFWYVFCFVWLDVDNIIDICFFPRKRASRLTVVAPVSGAYVYRFFGQRITRLTNFIVCFFFQIQQKTTEAEFRRSKL